MLTPFSLPLQTVNPMASVFRMTKRAPVYLYKQVDRLGDRVSSYEIDDIPSQTKVSYNPFY